ncbi:MAG: UDP-N-acetylglucosamine 1-carboxyvinyltransferase [Bacteroidetes bacterium]|nr:UDP-N-acetylglucosamine 1-carboxyvinyltransferase [Bacteroidota bacterium]
MDKFIVNGLKTLSGTVDIKGSKNEAFQVICASLLTNEKVIIQNIPNILDIKRMLELLKTLGIEVIKINENEYSIKATNINEAYLDSNDFISTAKQIRGSAMLAGPLLTRLKKMKLPKPGGDKIGRRPLNAHFNAFKKLGAEVFIDEKERYVLEANKLKGNYILLDEASVTGTASVIMAAVLAEGISTIYNAACEPYLFQLCNMLNKMGAKIKGIGSNMLIIEGVDKLSGVEHMIMPDIMEIGSFIGLASATKSNLKLNINYPFNDLEKNTQFDFYGNYLEPIKKGFDKIGVNIIVDKDKSHIEIPKQDQNYIDKQIDGTITQIADSPWPGFPPDLISILIVSAINATGTILIKQRMFESRLFFVDTLIEMGGHVILCDPHRVVVTGLNGNAKLKATKIKTPDIRAGLALLIAALSAKGTSVVENIEQIDRGYEDIENRLKKIGADIERVKG